MQLPVAKYLKHVACTTYSMYKQIYMIYLDMSASQLFQIFRLLGICFCNVEIQGKKKNNIK